MNWVTERRGFGRRASVRNLSNLQLSGVPCEFIDGIRRIRAAASRSSARAEIYAVPGQERNKKKRKKKEKKRARRNMK